MPCECACTKTCTSEPCVTTVVVLCLHSPLLHELSVGRYSPFATWKLAGIDARWRYISLIAMDLSASICTAFSRAIFANIHGQASVLLADATITKVFVAMILAVAVSMEDAIHERRLPLLFMGV